ncbi:hypothetical protein PIB30_035182 [Stylosanthes scabra]|uniref:Uncharacterized protein n=1 Tax=Stylosanthes scabra TaxID=79078 RepID=A0ABU6ZBJ6_9FABA|nr:hypothetical protein [Stylosanthes scabra]
MVKVEMKPRPRQSYQTSDKGSVTEVCNEKWSRYLPTSDEKVLRVLKYKRMLNRITVREFVWLSYRTPTVGAIVHPDIWQDDDRILWTSIIPLIYFR